MTPAAFAAFPEFLRRCGQAVPRTYLSRRPSADQFSLVEHACHLRDYEEEGFHARIQRILEEPVPFLPDFRGVELATERNYRGQDFWEAVEMFARRRTRSLALLDSLSPDQVETTGRMEGAGIITVRQLVAMVVEHDSTHRKEIEDLLAGIGRQCPEEP